MAPFSLQASLGTAGAYLVFFLIGFSFGAVLEMAGFANSPKLAAQFYFKDQTVLKVMFTGIVTAMVLVFGASALGLLDFNRVYVNPTYLWPGIVGGLIMGFGFIIGGFCPGTSLVAAATLKIDGIFFALGALAGIFLFGETVDSFAAFWNSSFLGRFTLPELFNVPIGVVVLGVVLMALFMFWGAEQLERLVGKRNLSKEPKLRYAGAGLLLAGALAVLVIGQPTVEERWARVAADKEPLLANREVQIHPGELLDLSRNNQINLLMYDMRDEADYNLFHITDAQRVEIEDLPGMVPALHAEPANTVVVVMGNDEARATEAWKVLVAEDLANVYILEGGINHWLDVFGESGAECCVSEPVAGDDTLRHVFTAALGSRHPASDPAAQHIDFEYVPRVKVEQRKATGGGGCG